MRGLSKDPNARYPDVLSFAKALEAALAGGEAPGDAARGGIFSKVKSLFKRD